MTKKIYMLGLVFLLSACSTSVLQQSESLSSVKTNTQINNLKVSEKGANLSVNLDFKTFNSKAIINPNEDGIPAKIVADVTKAKIYLIKNSNTNPLLSTNVVFTSGDLNYPNPNGNYIFYNVPVGTYYVAVELFDTNNNNIIEPITYTGDTAVGFTGGKRGLTLSTNSVTVTSGTFEYTFNDSSTEFKVSPKLLNAVGATINTNITSNSGNDTPTGPIIIEEVGS